MNSQDVENLQERTPLQFQWRSRREERRELFEAVKELHKIEEEKMDPDGEV